MKCKKLIYSLVVIAGLVCIVYVWSAALLSRDDGDRSVQYPDTQSKQFGVPLSEVVPPKANGLFAMMYSGKDVIPIRWGNPSNVVTDGFFWGDSSYPGFEYPVIAQYDYFIKSDSVTLVTSYGSYKYTFERSCPVFVEDDSLIERCNGKKIKNINDMTERLVIYNSTESTVYLYSLEEGTDIIVE